MKKDEEWLSAAEVYSRVVPVLNPVQAPITIASRAYDGILRTKARRFIRGKQTLEDVELPCEFWWATGHAALEQNWVSGDFKTWIDQKEHWRAYGVRFYCSDIDMILPEQDASVAKEAIGAVNLKPKNTGGRTLSKLWPEWVAELALYLHEEGIPAGEGQQGQGNIISAIEDSLAERGLECPSRTIVQPVVRAILLRLRSAGN